MKNKLPMIYLQDLQNFKAHGGRAPQKSKFERFQSPLVFLNEINWEQITNAGQEKLAPGSLVTLANPKGQPVAYGFFNPRSKIIFRVLGKGSFEDDDLSLGLQRVVCLRLDEALRKRKRVFEDFSFRLCFGESDGLPGLIIDLFESTENLTVPVIAVMQCHSAGADLLIPAVQDWLKSRMGIASGVIRNDLEVRVREGVPQYSQTWGDPFDAQQVFAREGELKFFIDVMEGQKTGYFYDHRINRRTFSKRIEGARGLDAFSYVGSWGLLMAKINPAMKVFCVDISKEALQRVERNARENGLSTQIEVVAADFLRDEALLRDLGASSFDAVACDPPSMSSHDRDSSSSLKAHERCLYRAKDFLAAQGTMAFSACSYHLSWEDLFEMAARVFRSQMEQVCVTYQGGQDADHPILTSLPETKYLKCFFLERLR